MKAKQTFVVTLLVTLASNVFSVGAPSALTGRYNFDYAIFGEGRSRPVQVFDDGLNTYLQFRAGADIPVFMSRNGDRKFNYELDGPYAVIKGTPRDLVAQFGNSKSQIVHSSLASNAAQYSRTGQPAAVKGSYPKTLVASNTQSELPYSPSASAQPANSWQDNSYATPRKGDHVQWAAATGSQFSQRIYFEVGTSKLTSDGQKTIASLANSLDKATDISVVGSDDTSYIEDLGESRTKSIRNALIKIGVAAELIRVKTAAGVESENVKRGSKTLVPSYVKWRIDPIQASTSAPKSPVASSSLERELNTKSKYSFMIRATDGTVEAMLKRWGEESGWQVISKGAPEIKINGDAELKKPNFLKAADVVIAQAKLAGHRIKASAYNNNVLVISGDESK